VKKLATQASVRAEAEALQGKRAGVRYGDLARALKNANCEHVSSSGSHRTWKHPNLERLLTLKDGRGDVLPIYIKLTRQYLEAIAETL
jgi:predicted RNA binding protein YcfA (HicA-like mRNA interferase family)